MDIAKIPATAAATLHKRKSLLRPHKMSGGGSRFTKLFNVGPPADSRRLGCAVQRLHDSPQLQRAFGQLHDCGPRPAAIFVAEMLDAIGANPAAIDAVLTWRRGIDPAVIAAIAREWPRCLHPVPEAPP